MSFRVIVTGSEGLIGRTLVPVLQRDGFSIVRLDRQLGHDLTDETWVKDAFVRQGPAGHLINLFAFNDHVVPGQQRGTLFDLPLQSFRDCMETNLTALFSVCREYARNNRGGNIINFGASTGIVSARPDMYPDPNGQPGHKHVGYSVSKAGVIHLTRVLAAHLAAEPWRVRCNCISPGGIEADQSLEFKELYGSHTPAGRMMKLTELVPAVRMLLDPMNTYMTGANITCDGGWTVV